MDLEKLQQQNEVSASVSIKAMMVTSSHIITQVLQNHRTNPNA